jgi:transcriptional regulator with XRE-family HTH domain
MTINKQKLKAEIGQRVKALRGKMTQAEFGKLFKKSQDAVCAYEKGIVFPPIDVIVKMAETFGVSVEWIITGETGKRTKEGKEKGFAFKNRFIREGEPEWKILEVLSAAPQNVKEEVLALVSSYIKERKKK